MKNKPVREFGLIGYPLGHSFSRQFFAEKFAREGHTDCRYENYPLENIGLFPALLEQHPALEGLNVTIPYKQQVMPFMDELSDAASEVGAVNCIRFQKGMRKGYNTDVIGFERSLRPLLEPHHVQALILGTGGAARAVAWVLARLGIAAELVSRQGNAAAGIRDYASLDEPAMERYTLLINTTPLGMYPQVNACPDIPYNLLSPRHLLYDLVYNPAETLFLRRGREQGAQVKNGEEMLILQAEASWEIWNTP
ncbi:shikimate dehydrogenase [Compostibacter hankyongensis]|uniref:Shikimate dehydrogenase n=1 Tax=Compostibacter hankyongensis TaxID=1007089 RepID=A0ABP8FXL5_9BACT